LGYLACWNQFGFLSFPKLRKKEKSVTNRTLKSEKIGAIGFKNEERWAVALPGIDL